MPKIAYLFMSYSAPEVMVRTMGQIRHPDDAFFVHFDKKILGDDRMTLVEGLATVVADPVDVRWGTFSMIEAEVKLLTLALASGDFTHFVLLSDDASPLRDVEALRAALTSDKHPRPPKPVPPEKTSFQDRYRNFWLFGKKSARERLVLTADDREDVASLAYWMGRGKADVPLYHSSQWWAISRPVAEYMLREHHANEHLRMSFTYSRIPDEHYFQTIIWNSEFREQGPRTIMHTEWPPAGEKWSGPRTFTEESDFTRALRSDRFFVRKISNPATADLLDRLRRQGLPSD